MKFQVREGFVVHIPNKVDKGDGTFDVQINTFFGKQFCDLSPEQADGHFHKLEPKDKAAIEYLESKVLPVAPGQALGLAPEAMALVEALATAMAAKIVEAVQTPAQAPAPAAT